MSKIGLLDRNMQETMTTVNDHAQNIIDTENALVKYQDETKDSFNLAEETRLEMGLKIDTKLQKLFKLTDV